MQLPVVKLLDFQGREATLERHPNIFAIVVLASLAKLKSKDVEPRYHAKRRLVRLLYERGHTKDEICDLLRFLDWILCLPRELEEEIIREAHYLESKKVMPFLSNIERWAIEEGLKKGEMLGQKRGEKLGKILGKKLGRKLGKAEGLRAGERRGLAPSPQAGPGAPVRGAGFGGPAAREKDRGGQPTPQARVGAAEGEQPQGVRSGRRGENGG